MWPPTASLITCRAMSDEAVLTERRDRVLLITINRPEARNAVNLPVAEGIAAALDELDADDGLSIGVLTGAGGGFCAGMDLKAFVTGERPWVGDRGFAGIVQRASRKPLIAAVEGFAVAGGLEIALACDLIVSARGAKLGVPEVKRSLVAAGGALLRLPRRMPYGLAMELALTGDHIDAERAHELGLVNRLADPGGAVDVARRARGEDREERPARARGHQAGPPGAVRLDRGGVLGEAGRDHRPGLRLRGRPRGRRGVRREARAGLAGQVDPLGPRVESGPTTR